MIKWQYKIGNDRGERKNEKQVIERERSMRLYAPCYYKHFKCIADRCEHSCCIGWEIDIDKDTLKKYKGMKDGYGTAIADSISMKGSPHFVLDECERCPHLDEQGLCRIIKNVGEDHLCDICREHPRFYNYTDVCEVGIGMSCPEAARIILASAEYATLEELGTVDAVADEIGFDARALRAEVYAILCDASQSYKDRLSAIYRRFSLDVGEDEGWLGILDSLEYLHPEHKALFMKYSAQSRPEGADEYLERALAYFVYRHCTEALDEGDFAARLAFCLFCERLLASLILSEQAKDLQGVAALARVLSEEIEYSDDNTFSLMY